MRRAPTPIGALPTEVDAEALLAGEVLSGHPLAVDAVEWRRELLRIDLPAISSAIATIATVPVCVLSVLHHRSSGPERAVAYVANARHCAG